MKQNCLALLIILTILLQACGGGSASGPQPGPLVTVSVSAISAPLNTGATHTFSVSVANTSNTAVTWSVVEAAGGSITQAGTYTAPATPGTYTVKATSPIGRTSCRG